MASTLSLALYYQKMKNHHKTNETVLETFVCSESMRSALAMKWKTKAPIAQIKPTSLLLSAQNPAKLWGLKDPRQEHKWQDSFVLLRGSGQDGGASTRAVAVCRGGGAPTGIEDNLDTVLLQLTHWWDCPR